MRRRACELCGLGPRHEGLRICGACFVAHQRTLAREFRERMVDLEQPPAKCGACGQIETPDQDERDPEPDDVSLCFIDGQEGWVCTRCAFETEGEEWKAKP